MGLIGSKFTHTHSLNFNLTHTQNNNSYEQSIINKYYDKSTIKPTDKIISIPIDKINYVDGIYCGIKQKFKGIEINPNLKPIELKDYDIKAFDINRYTKIIDLNYKKYKTYQTYNKTKPYRPDKDFVECQYLQLPNEPEPIDYLGSYHGIFGLFFSAYCSHKNIILRPDDIWFHILEQIQIIINDNPENLRKYFVEHMEKESIVVEFGSDFKFDSEYIGKFIEQINEKINSKVKGDFVQITNSNFTTTSSFDKTLYNITTMISMKEYFDYNLEISCGIKKIYFGGDLEDWQKIITNLHKLKSFGSEISNYVNNIIPIIDEFINAFNGNPNIGFINRAIRKDAEMAGHLKSNGYFIGSNEKPYDIKKYVDGWIKDLYWFGDKSDILPKEFEKKEFHCEFKFNQCNNILTKELVTSNSVGMMYYKSIDSFGMIKSWWVRNPNPNPNQN